jgi:O-antigen/teichoic acid export membrane protein
MRNDIKTVIKNSVYLYFIQGFNYLLPLLTLPYLLIILSKESFGIYIYSLSFSQFAMLFIDFGFNLSGTKKITVYEENSDELLVIYWTITMVKFLLFLLSVVVCLSLAYSLPVLNIYFYGILMTVVGLLGSVFFPIWWFQGLNKMIPLMLINAISKIISYPFLFVFVKESNDSAAAILIQSLSYLFAALLSVTYIFYRNRSYLRLPVSMFNFLSIKGEIREAWPIFLSNSATSFYTNSLTIILGFFSVPSNVGLFGAIERIIRVVCLGVYVPINQACFPLIARLAVTDLKRAKYLFKKVFFSLFFLMSITCFFFIIFQDYIVLKFFSEYPDINLILSLSILAIIPIALGGACGQLGLLALGNDVQKKIFSKVYLFVGVLSLPVTLISIYIFKVEGAVFSMVLIETIIFCSMFYYCKKFLFI